MSGSRRRFLRQSLGAIGSLMWTGSTLRAGSGGARPHHVPSAKSVIYLYMEGGPSQIDTFDPKPLLSKMAGEPLPFETPSTVFNSSNKILPSPFRFQQFGESGTWVSELFPQLARCVDDLTFVHSLHHGVSNHSAACYLSHTGDAMAGRPSLGAWLTYGLESENDDLPGYIVLDCGQAPSGGAPSWSSGFLPARHGGVFFSNNEAPVEFIKPLESSAGLQTAKLEAIRRLQRSEAEAAPYEATLTAMMNSYEKAERMQAVIPDIVDLSDEPQSMTSRYGLDDPNTRTFGSRCLIARRLVESGVRFVEVFSPRVKADRWDQHGNLKQGHTLNCRAVDRPIAGLIQDLKSRGLLDETIVMWGGEFGRTPSSQGGTGRDHNPFGYTVFLAGGGLKPGCHHGATDEFGYYAQRDKVHLHDLHATLLHQLGIDHKRLTYRFDGRDYRLTDVYGRVVTEVIA